ncbi:hypothetical protein [Virgibacillus pantothenticus]|uniref:hypothetical protein n=1 Tax=Virgibacillus pantothenticus TaxID=1473 RepID=UPI0025AF31DD|nr:hypothetical protein [Virgibacillus pantothenticus]
MSFANINIDIDQKEIRDYVNAKLDEALENELFLCDINELAKRTCMSKSFLENEILCDPRMRLLERRKEKGKRFWFYKESLEVIREIMNEW